MATKTVLWYVDHTDWNIPFLTFLAKLCYYLIFTSERIFYYY